MDNIAHTLVAGAMARAGLEKVGPRAGATLLVSANVPDLDILVALVGPGGYLTHHRGITHSLVGVALLAPVTAVGMLLLDRWLLRRADGDEDPTPARFAPLCLMALVGLASHLALDACNAYGVRPFLPFDDGWRYNDWLAIIDPWMWLVPGLFLYWDTASTPRRHLAWALGAGALTAVILASGATSTFVRWVWLSSLPVAAIVVSFRSRRWRRRLARVPLVLIPIYLYWAAGQHDAALERVEDYAPAGHQAAVLPIPGQPGSWRLVYYGADSVYLGRTGTGGPGDVIPDLQRHPVNLQHPAVRAASDLPAVRALLGFARFPFARIEERPDGWLVRLIDARYAWEGDETWGVATARIPHEALDR